MSSDKYIREKLETALNFKNEGNELYKAKHFKKAMRKYHNGILYLKGIDNDLHGTPSFLQAASVNPDSDKKISAQMELECINANIRYVFQKQISYEGVPIMFLFYLAFTTI